MRLLNTLTLELEAFDQADVPVYAILSHTWNNDEVTYAEIRDINESIRAKRGFSKIDNCCRIALEQYGMKHVWIDTCCINKESSAELSEAINSMYKWYKHASACIVYLADVPVNATIGDFRSSRWFTRGWTLQELVAISKRTFFVQTWSKLDTSSWTSSLDETIHDITGITPKVLADNTKIRECCVAERMSWAAMRSTQRPEDVAYCLLGIFEVNMAILYGEGETGAFRRLQDEIMKNSFDQTLFAWRSDQEESGLLAQSPRDFVHTPRLGLWRPDMLAPMVSTNIGILFRPCVATDDSSAHDGVVKVALQCDVDTRLGWMCLVIWLKKVPHAYCYAYGQAHDAYRRIHCDIWEAIPSDELEGVEYVDMLVLETANYELLQIAIEQDTNRHKEKSYGNTALIMSARHGDSAISGHPLGAHALRAI